jgi:uncharacterized repeat protein (TIGR03803 family)
MQPTSRVIFFLPMIALFLVVPFFKVSAQTYTYKDLYNFNCSTDACGLQQPIPLTQGRDGNLYGMSYGGGTSDGGTAWRIGQTPGSYSTLYDFPSGSFKNIAINGLALGLDGNFYGTTVFLDTNNQGYIFKLTPAKVLTDIYDFASGPDGGIDGEPLTQGPDGNLYGHDWYNCYFFKITIKTGAFSNVSPTCPNPNTSYYGLILGADGKFYGNVSIGGVNNKGEVYTVTTAGKITVIHSFNGTDGEVPVGNLVQATDGNFYGVTQQTSTSTSTGEIFKITPAGKLTVLHTFNTDGSEGTYIQSGLVAASDGNLYGVTTAGGATNGGVLFQVTHTGTFTKLRDFNCLTDPCNNWVALAQRTDGTLYGVGTGGSSGSNGGVYTVSSSSFHPFIRVQNHSAKAGQTVDILGSGFTGATAVDFDGIAATSFKVVSANFITAVVSSAAETGLVTVTTPSGKLSTQASFKVKPAVTSFNPTSGPVGTPVTIMGTGLTGASKVTFGGVKATTFTVNSPTKITANVPTGAITGPIAVTTIGGTGSEGTFTVN